MKYVSKMDSPIGALYISSEENAIVGIDTAPTSLPLCETPLLLCAKTQLTEYFAGNRKCFDLPLMMQAPPFTKSVWDALCEIPYGETSSYGEIAARLGNPRAARAVGMANHINPIMIIVPCHRVIGKSGALTGYAGGLAIKGFLLKLEAEHCK